MARALRLVSQRFCSTVVMHDWVCFDCVCTLKNVRGKRKKTLNMNTIMVKDCLWYGVWLPMKCPLRLNPPRSYSYFPDVYLKILKVCWPEH